MHTTIQVDVLASETTPRIPGTWPLPALRALLSTLMDEEGGAWTDDEIPELLTMALQDLPPEAAGEAVLAHLVDPRVRRGQRDHMVTELRDGRAWERHSVIENHLPLFETAELIQPAHPQVFAAPVAHHLELRLTATDDAGRALLATDPPPAVLCRLVAFGTREGLLYRLFDTSLDGDSFPEAEHVVWRSSVVERNADSIQIALYGSHQWFGPVEAGASWVAETWPDTAPE